MQAASSHYVGTRTKSEGNALCVSPSPPYPPPLLQLTHAFGQFAIVCPPGLVDELNLAP